MVGHATHIVYVDVTLTRSNIKVTDLLKFRRTGRGYNLVIVIAGRLQQAVHAGGSDDRQPPCRAFYSCTQFLPVSCVNVRLTR